MKLKDKKIEILENKVTFDRIGNHLSQLIPVVTVWAYFRQLSGDEVFAAAHVNLTENVLSQIGYRADITTAHVIRFNCKQQKWPQAYHLRQRAKLFYYPSDYAILLNRFFLSIKRAST